MAANYNINALNVVLIEILDEIVADIMDSTFADESDESLVRLVTPLYNLDTTIHANNMDLSSSRTVLLPNPQAPTLQRKAHRRSTVENNSSSLGKIDSST